jgi:ElaB/YqjD/DUF883 family membrane-anchored ribosome-binding protein
MAYTTPTSGQSGAADGAADQAKEKVQQGAEQAKSTLRSQVDQRSTDAGSKLKSQADDIQTVAQQLREQGSEQPAKVAEQAAERVQRVGGYLHDSDADRILSDAEDYARNNPWVVVAGGLAAGFLASRFLKASSSDRYRRGTSVPPSGNGHSSAQSGRYGVAPASAPNQGATGELPRTTGGGAF